MKRWSGGEFCSPAHQKQYNDEYNQLALHRLLQIKPVIPPHPAEKTKPAPSAKFPEKRDPGFTGFVIEAPRAAKASVIPADDLVPVWRSSPFIPSRRFETGEAQFASPAKVMVESSLRIRDSATHRNNRSLDTREFARSGPVLGPDVPMDGIGLERAEEPMDILYLPYPAPGSPRLWREPATLFEPIGTELGAFARAAFRTTGNQDNEDLEAPPAPPADSPTLLDPALPGLGLKPPGSFLTKLLKIKKPTS